MKLLVKWDRLLGEKLRKDYEMKSGIFKDMPNGIYQVEKEGNEIRFRLEKALDKTQTQLEEILVK